MELVEDGDQWVTKLRSTKLRITKLKTREIWVLRAKRRVDDEMFLNESDESENKRCLNGSNERVGSNVPR